MQYRPITTAQDIKNTILLLQEDEIHMQAEIACDNC